MRLNKLFEFQTVIVLLLAVNQFVGAQYDYDEVVETKSNCVKLPQNTTSATQPEFSDNLVNLLQTGTSMLFPPEVIIPTDAVLILGNTGCGKTTLTQMIAGDLSKLQAVETDGGKLVIIDDNDKIGAPRLTSKTFIPELVNTSEEAFFDCPGFDDNRGALYDVAVSYFMNTITEKVARVKLIFLINHNSVEIGKYRNEFDHLATHATQFVKVLNRFQTSVGLVVTKVETHSTHKERKLTHAEIKKSIMSFLQTYKDDIQKLLAKNENSEERDMILRKVQFVDILLNKDAGYYSRIAFSSSPESCGRLNESAVVADTRIRVLKMIRHLNFSEVGESAENFGFTLKDKTIIKLVSFTKQINEAIRLEISKQVENLKAWNNTVYSESMESLPIVGYKLVNMWKNVELLNIEDTSFLTNIAVDICVWFSAMGYNCSKAFQEFMADKQTYLEFFDKATEGDVERRPETWLDSIYQVQQQIRNDHESCKLEIATIWVKRVNDMITSGVQTEAQSLIENIEYKLNEEAHNLPILSNETWKMLSQGCKFSHDSFNNTYGFLESVAARTANLTVLQISVDFVENLTLAEKAFEFFEDFLQVQVDRDVESWGKPLLSVEKKLDDEKANYQKDIRVKYAPESNRRALQCFNDVKTDFLDWFGTEKAKEVYNYPRISNEMRLRWNISIPLPYETLKSPLEILNIYRSSLTRIGYNTTERDKYCVETETKLLDYFDYISEEKLHRFERWTTPLYEMKKALEDSQNEYLKLLDIQFIKQANEGVAGNLNITLSNFVTWAETSFIKIHQDINNVDVLLDNINKIRDSLTGLDHIFSVTFENDLMKIFESFNFTISADYLLVKKHLDDLEFFDDIKGFKVQRNIHSWKTPLIFAIARVDQIKNMTIEKVQQYGDKINKYTANHIENIIKTTTRALDDKLRVMTTSKIQETLRKSFYEIGNINPSTNLAELARSIKVAVETMGATVDAEFINKCSRNEQLFQKFDKIPELPNQRNTSTWLKSLQTLKARINDLQIWYNFCEEVAQKLEQYAFHSSKPSVSYLTTTEELAKRTAYSQLPPHLKRIGEVLQNENGIHSRNLVKLYENALAPINVKCGNSITEATGNYILFSNVIRQCIDSRVVEIYAKKRIFIDKSFEANGAESRFVLVAPYLEVVGKQLLNLNGRDGGSHDFLRADNGKYTDEEEQREAGRITGIPVSVVKQFFGNVTPILVTAINTEHQNETNLDNPDSSYNKYLTSMRSASNGLAGRAGFPGGSFLAVSLKIVHPSSLTVTCNGGKGGKGQHGGNGSNGNNCDMEHHNTTSPISTELGTELIKTGKHTCNNTARPGGNGGDGGVGGLGGKPGSIKIYAFGFDMVKTETDFGDVGEIGLGGVGGLGGKGVNSTICNVTKKDGRAIKTECENEIGHSSKNGEKGNDGTSYKGREQPKEPAEGKDRNYARQKYFSLYGNEATKTTFSEWD